MTGSAWASMFRPAHHLLDDGVFKRGNTSQAQRLFRFDKRP